MTRGRERPCDEDEYASALQIIGYQAHCAPDDQIALFNRRDGGICLFLMQRYEEAVEELTGYLDDSLDEGTADRQQVMQMVKAAQEQLARAAAQKSVESAVGETSSSSSKKKKKNDDGSGDDDVVGDKPQN